jgi:hypothetical protein
LSEAARPARAVLDTVFSRVLHQLIGRIATELRLLTLIWSDELIAEAERALIDRKPMPAPAARRWAGYLREAFPEARIDLATLPDGIDLGWLTTDAGDQHVCALAIAGGADLLITSDHGYLEEPLSRYGIAVRAPDRVLAEIFAEQPSAILSVLRRQAAVWGGGPAARTAFGRARPRSRFQLRHERARRTHVMTARAATSTPLSIARGDDYLEIRARATIPPAACGSPPIGLGRRTQAGIGPR